jgi:hypothetical protein
VTARPHYALLPGIRPGRRPLACHHEAGHALARWCFGHAFDRVVVLSTEQVAGGHRLREGRGGRAEELVEGRLEGHSLGPAAPRAAYERLWARSSDQDQVARQRLGFRVEVEQELIACAAGPAAEAAYRHCRAATVRLGGGEVDEAHMSRLLADWFAEGEADVVRERAWRLAAALVRSPPGARAVGELAAALRARGRVRFQQARPVFEAAYGRPQPAHGAWAGCWPPSARQLRAGWMP